MEDLVSRLSRVERQLNLMTTPDMNTRDGSEEVQRECNLPSVPGTTSDVNTRAGRISCGRTPSPQVLTFSGETSIAHNLTIVEGRLEQMGVQYERHQSASPNHPFKSRLTPSPDSPFNRVSERQPNLLHEVLEAHGIFPSRAQWDGLMTTFCDEVHILVPFLHPPSLWTLYEEVWECSFIRQTGTQERSGVRRVHAAHILICLANGRCVESSRREGDQGPYSAGWSLYSAARELFGDLLAGFSQCSNQLFVLQTVLLMVRLACVLAHRIQSLLSFLDRWFTYFVSMHMGLPRRSWP